MINTERDDKQFRRGAVLGFTMSEILLLLIFLLMLLMVSNLQSKDDELALLKGAGSKYAELESELKALRELRDAVERQGGIDKFDPLKNYTHAIEERNAATDRVKALEIQIKEMEAAAGDARPLIEEAKRMSPDKPIADAITHMVAVARTGDAIDKEGTPDEKKFAAAQTCMVDLKNCQGQVAFVTDKYNAKMGGRDKPPCWVDANNQAEFIFNATIKDDGIILTDNKVKGKEAVQAKLPIQDIPLGKPMSVSTFNAAVKPLFNWSEENNCRFYVRIFKGTSATLLAADYNPMFEATINNFYFSLRK